jgi:hypothetical protein
MGLPNDTAGTYGTLQGYMYNQFGKRITRGTFFLGAFLTFEDPIFFLPDSSYTINVFSCKTCVLNLYTSLPSSLMIDSLCFYVEPDSVVRRDIHLKMPNPYGISEGWDDREIGISIINYPNPFNSVTHFSVVIPQLLRHQRGTINIYNVSGQEIKKIDVSLQTTVEWDGTDIQGFPQPTGVYYYQLVFNNHVYKKGSMVLLK